MIFTFSDTLPIAAQRQIRSMRLGRLQPYLQFGVGVLVGVPYW